MFVYYKLKIDYFTILVYLQFKTKLSILNMRCLLFLESNQLCRLVFY
jgi:hypothetical protein